MASSTAASAPQPSAGPSQPPSSSELLTENIQYMKLLHELKAAFPVVSDDFVKNCILNVSTVISCLLFDT